MTRSAHTYRLGDVEVVLTVPEGIRVPRALTLKRTSDAADAVFEHAGVKAVRARTKPKPRIAAQTMIPEDWTPPPAELEKLRASCPSVNFDHELAQLRDFYIGKGQHMKDWTAVWRRWMRKTHKENVERGWKPSAKPRGDETAKERWIRTHGLTVAEYEAKKGDAEWLKMIERRGVVA
ncbi:hypothetical protein [Microbacterium paludicola]|uniref:hypothetical protein n=1 Tax=Microbacterium paludicola TaxID=300019 RepID=UPI0011A504FE|nr:hypothetical protein [Microbacterium paludicola]